jgi:hypothetical protein
MSLMSWLVSHHALHQCFWLATAPKATIDCACPSLSGFHLSPRSIKSTVPCYNRGFSHSLADLTTVGSEQWLDVATR